VDYANLSAAAGVSRTVVGRGSPVPMDSVVRTRLVPGVPNPSC
jgi:hypothetical protein